MVFLSGSDRIFVGFIVCLYLYCPYYRFNYHDGRVRIVCSVFFLYSLIQLSRSFRGRFRIPLAGLTLPHLCVCPKTWISSVRHMSLSTILVFSKFSRCDCSGGFFVFFLTLVELLTISVNFSRVSDLCPTSHLTNSFTECFITRND